MARLVLRSGEQAERVIELYMGVNRFGRSPDNHFQIDHPSVSARHCEIVLAANDVVVRDCNSTNGTFIAGEQIQESPLVAGQSLFLGDVELFVESTDATVAIPKFSVPLPAPPVVLTDGSLICPRHSRSHATYQCTHCREVMCDACVHRLRRRGGKLLKLCPLCSHQCEPIGGEKKRRKSLL